MTKDEYLAHCATMPRKELLKVCRAGGLAAHRIKENSELALLLWKRFGAKREKREKSRTC